MSRFIAVDRLQDRLSQSEWIVCKEALRCMAESPSICGVVSMSGPNGEPLACGYWPDHDGAHAWSTLPTFPAALPSKEEKP